MNCGKRKITVGRADGGTWGRMDNGVPDGAGLYAAETEREKWPTLD